MAGNAKYKIARVDSNIIELLAKFVILKKFELFKVYNIKLKFKMLRNMELLKPYWSTILKAKKETILEVTSYKHQ